MEEIGRPSARSPSPCCQRCSCNVRSRRQQSGDEEHFLPASAAASCGSPAGTAIEGRRGGKDETGNRDAGRTRGRRGQGEAQGAERRRSHEGRGTAGLAPASACSSPSCLLQTTRLRGTLPAGSTRPAGTPLPLGLLLIALTGVLCLFSAGCHAEVAFREVYRSNERWVLLARFAFAGNGGGRVALNVSRLRVYSPEGLVNPDTSYMGFLIAPEPAVSEVEGQPQQPPDSANLDAAATPAGEPTAQGMPGSGAQGHQNQPLICPLTSMNVTRLLSVREMGLPGHGGDRPDKSVTVPVAYAGWCSVYLVNCAPSRLISAQITVTMYNEGGLDMGGRESEGAPQSPRYYLPTGRIYLAVMYLVVAGGYLLAFLLWLCHVQKIWCQAVVPPAFQLHLTLLLPLLMLVYSFSSLCLLATQTYGAPVAWVSFSTNLLAAAATVAFLAAFVSGLDRVEPYQGDFERVVLLVAVPLWALSCLGFNMLFGPTYSIAAAALGTATPAPSSTTFLSLFVPRLLLACIPLEVVASGIRSVWLFSLALMALLVVAACMCSCCWHLATRASGSGRRGSGGGRQGRGGVRGNGDHAWGVVGPVAEEDAAASRLCVQACCCILLASVVAALLPLALPFYLASWLPDGLAAVVGVAFAGYALFRVRPRAEKSVYQLFDEVDDDDDEDMEELTEL